MRGYSTTIQAIVAGFFLSFNAEAGSYDSWDHDNYARPDSVTDSYSTHSYTGRSWTARDSMATGIMLQQMGNTLNWSYFNQPQRIQIQPFSCRTRGRFTDCY